MCSWGTQNLKNLHQCVPREHTHFSNLCHNLSMTAASRHGAGWGTDARVEHAPSRVPGHALVAGTCARHRALSSRTASTRSMPWRHEAPPRRRPRPRPRLLLLPTKPCRLRALTRRPRSSAPTAGRASATSYKPKSLKMRHLNTKTHKITKNNIFFNEPADKAPATHKANPSESNQIKPNPITSERRSPPRLVSTYDYDLDAALVARPKFAPIPVHSAHALRICYPPRSKPVKPLSNTSRFVSSVCFCPSAMEVLLRRNFAFPFAYFAYFAVQIRFKSSPVRPLFLCAFVVQIGLRFSDFTSVSPCLCGQKPCPKTRHTSQPWSTLVTPKLFMNAIHGGKDSLKLKPPGNPNARFVHPVNYQLFSVRSVSRWQKIFMKPQ